MYPNKYITELLKDAINSEAMTVEYYQQLASDVSDIDDRERLRQMSLDEKKHYNMLMEMYKAMAGKDFEEGDKKEVPKGENVLSRIAASIDKELENVEAYRPILFALEDPMFKNYLQEIITDEQNHAARLNYMYSKNK